MPIPDGLRTDYSYSTYAVAPQQGGIPSCVAPPPACTLGFDTGNATEVVNVTLRGDADGTIKVYWTGSTGTTSCTINGTLDGTETGNDYTFTGLEAGYYNILIEEGDCFAQELNVQVLDGEFRTGDFIVNTPAALTATELPILINLKTAYNNETTPAYAEYKLSVLQTIYDGDSLTFTFEYPQAYTATFYAKNFPSRGNYFLASTLKDGSGNDVGSNSFDEIATSIGEVLSNDVVISRLYWIRVDGATIYINAKEQSSKLNLGGTEGVIDIATTSFIGIIGTTIVQGAAAYDGAISADYSLYSDILINTNVQYGEVPDDASFDKVTQLELPFNSATNKHIFDLSPVLKNFVSTPKIDFTLTGSTTLASMLCGYKVQYGEKYPLVQNSTTKKSRVKGTTDVLYTLNAALPWEEANNLTTLLGDRLHNIKANFDGDVDRNSSTSITIDIDDYLWDTTATTTTYNFRFTRVDGSGTPTDTGWQTGNTATITGITSYANGKVYITGSTDGVYFEYNKDWWAYPQYYVGDVEGYNTQPNIQHNVEWLTNSPNPKFVQRDSSEFLYLLLPKDYGKTLKIKGDLYFYDGTSLTGETLYTVSTGSTNYGGVFCFAAGYNELNLASYETYSGGTRKIRKVDFALYQNDAENGDYLLSEEKSYRYEIDEQPRRFGVAFLNKYGCFDIFDFSGEIVDTGTHNNQTMEVPRALGLQGNAPLGFEANTVYETSVLKRHECNTGWIDEEHFDWLIELLSSNKIYNYTDDAQPFLIVESINYEKSSNDDLYNIDVVFAETLQENNVKV